MLNPNDNELLCKTGPGTPMGALFRRFWLPALLSSEIPEPDSPPIRFQILNEKLVAFRDSEGRVGFVAEACPHRGASMFFGRNEEAGLRCVYHGWKFDVTGACVDMPSEPAESNFRNKVRIGAYPSAEMAGMVWIYMGPPEKQPPLPQYDWTNPPAGYRVVATKWMQDSNYAQCIEGNIDSAHVTFLHRNLNSPAPATRPYIQNRPELSVKATEFGFVYGARREAEPGTYYWRLTPFVSPLYSIIPTPMGGSGLGFISVPINDESCWWFTIGVAPELRPGSPPPPTGGGVELIPGSFRFKANKDNDYLIDREMQRTENYTGIANIRAQDAAMMDSMGSILDRRVEHLGTSDAAVIYMRRMLLRMAQDLQNGIEPSLPSQAEHFLARPLDTVTEIDNLDDLWDQHHAAVKASAQENVISR